MGPYKRPDHPNGIRTRISTLRKWPPDPISKMERWQAAETAGYRTGPFGYDPKSEVLETNMLSIYTTDLCTRFSDILF